MRHLGLLDTPFHDVSFPKYIFLLPCEIILNLFSLSGLQLNLNILK